MLKKLKERAAEQANRLLQNPDVQRAISWAEQARRRVRGNLAEARRTLAEALTTESRDDLEQLKRDLDAMTEESERS